MKFYRKKYMSW